MDLARSAAAKWREAVRFGAPAFSLEQMRNQIAGDSHREIAGLLLAKADWFSGVMAFALFHRTWNGNLYLDFLAANPATRSPRLHGVGLWLLVELFAVAAAVESEVVWGETTQSSVGYYAKNLKTTPSDLLIIPARLRRAFTDRMLASLKASDTAQSAEP